MIPNYQMLYNHESTQKTYQKHDVIQYYFVITKNRRKCAFENKFKFNYRVRLEERLK